MPAAQTPSTLLQEKHRLTHVPYEPWREACVAFRARPDRRETTGEASGGIPCVSLDFCYTRAHGGDREVAEVETALWLVMVCSQTGFIRCVPLKSKGQINLISHGVVSFVQLLGHHEVSIRGDNEGAMKQILRVVTAARFNRSLAGSFMHHLQTKLNSKFSSSHPLWTWAARHAAWTLNRYQATKGITPFEVVYQKGYVGRLAEFGEPVYAYVKSSRKGEAKWYKSLFLGKPDGQDSFLVFNGSSILLTRSIRRVAGDWKMSLALYTHFQAFSWQYQSSFGARVVAARQQHAMKAGANLPAPLSYSVVAGDEEAEAVMQKALEEEREEKEVERMSKEDVAQQRLETEEPPDIPDDTPLSEFLPTRASPAPASGQASSQDKVFWLRI